MPTTKAATRTFAMSTTMLPFLYQTRTLSGLLLSTQGSFRQISRSCVISRQLTTSARKFRAFDPDNIPTTTASKQGNPEDDRSAKYAPYRSQSAGHRRIIPEYRRKGGRYDDGILTSRPQRSLQGYDDDHSTPGAIEFDGGVNTDRYVPRESTITPREQQAFQKIFSDIFERSKNGKPTIQPKTGDREKAKTALNSILGRAIEKLPKSRLEIEQAISKYPPALREDAAKAMLLDNESSLRIDETEEVDRGEAKANQAALRLKAEELEALRAPERLRVETLMREAKTDFELWEVMEKEVFSLIHKLGLEEQPKPPKMYSNQMKQKFEKRQKGWKKLELKQKTEGRQDIEVENNASDEQTNKEADHGVSLQLFGPLYPSYLLLGLRLLDRSFSKPSPLALSILPKIKSLGFISHVLGASTGFYNDLLLIYRYRYDDFPGMLKLLEDMEQSALDMDEDTLTIVIDVMKIQASVKHYERGGALKALWAMPEYAPREFSAWRTSIYSGIQERKRNDSSPVY